MIILCQALPIAGTAVIPFGIPVKDRGDFVSLVVAVVLILAGCGLITVREVSKRSQDAAVDEANATLRAAYKDALQPVAEQLADMQTMSPKGRQTQLETIANQACSALDLLLDGIQDLRVVVYLVDDPGAEVLKMCPVAKSRGRNGRRPGDFVLGTPRGDAAFSTLFADDACFVNDVDDRGQLAAMGAYSGTRDGYAAFISQSIFDQRMRYGMVTVDTPRRSAFVDTDKHLVGLVADLIAVACAAVSTPRGLTMNPIAS